MRETAVMKWTPKVLCPTFGVHLKILAHPLFFYICSSENNTMEKILHGFNQ